MQKLANYINGELREPLGDKWLDVVDPAVGAVYAHAPASDHREVDLAVEAAERAFSSWSRTSIAERAAVLRRIADLIDRDLEKLAKAESIDTGKPIALARALDIPRSATNFRFFAGAIEQSSAECYSGDLPQGGGRRTLHHVLRQPRGVAGLISPWNLPLYLLSWKIAPAIATGNCAVAKPSEVTPMTAHLLGQLCIEAGVPSGVINIVHGTGPSAGEPLVRHVRVPTVSFTGGTATGAAIATACAPMFKRVSLELGGKNPTIVFADADLDQAIPTAVRAAFSNQGQICLCGSRVLVEHSIYDQFLGEFVDRVKRLRMGDPLDPTTEQGAVVSAAHRQKVLEAIEQARRDGGRVACGGGPPSAAVSDRCRDGYFIEPTVITNLSAGCAALTQEIFGPVVTVQPFTSDDEAIVLANSTRYGLAASVWTTDLDRANRMAAQLETGVLWINCWMVRDLRTPFGGVKQSGVGREGGTEALRFFTEPKSVCTVV